MFGLNRPVWSSILCLAAIAPSAFAGGGALTQCHNGSVPLANTNWTNSVTVPKFDPALGTLLQVTFQLDSHVEGFARVESTDTSAASVQLLYGAAITLLRPDLTPIVTGNPTTTFNDSLGPFDGVIDFGGPSGASHPGISLNDTDTATSPPPLSDLALFTGLGTITLPVTGVGQSQAVGTGNVITQFSTRASATVQVCYIYAPCACSHAPVIAGCTPSTTDLGCNPATLPECGQGVTASDECGSVPVTCAVTDGSEGCFYSRTITYTATNDCGTSTCSRTFTWKVDTTPPTFDNCVTGTTDLGCNPATLPGCENVTATDNCGPATVTCVPSDSTVGCVTTRTIVYTARDACNNTSTCTRTFTWKVDTTPPTFDNCTGGTTDLGCNPATLPGCESVTATDNCGPATVTCVPSDVVNGCTTTRTIVYTARDACNNTSTCTRVFTWKTDTTPPTFDNCTTGTTDLGCNPATLPTCENVTATDNCGPATVTCVPSDSTVGCVTTRTIVYTARDACNNTATCTRTFTWKVDTTPPTFDNCVTGTTDLGPNPQSIPGCDSTVTASDNCGTATVTCSVSDSNSGCSNTRTITYTARDACNNTATCTRTYTWGASGQICATKYYDANANGVRDQGEVGIAGWKFQLSDGQTGFTNAQGQVCFTTPGIGTYTVTELSPTQTNWAASTPTSCQVTVTADNCSASCSFGNYCYRAPSNGLTIGFWRNKNGKAVLQANDPAWRNVLNGLNLRKADGSLFQIPTAGSFAAAFDVWSNWLQGATATNMAYMLSAQLAATTLNVSFNGLSDGTTIIVPGGEKTGGGVCVVPFLSVTQAISCGAPPLLTLTAQPGSTACGCSSNNGSTTIGNLRARAVCLLGAYGLVTSAGTVRTYEEAVKDLLDSINNNGNNGYACGGLSQYVNPSSASCPVTFP